MLSVYISRIRSVCCACVPSFFRQLDPLVCSLFQQNPSMLLAPQVVFDVLILSFSIWSPEFRLFFVFDARISLILCHQDKDPHNHQADNEFCPRSVISHFHQTSDCCGCYGSCHSTINTICLQSFHISFHGTCTPFRMNINFAQLCSLCVLTGSPFTSLDSNVYGIMDRSEGRDYFLTSFSPRSSLKMKTSFAAFVWSHFQKPLVLDSSYHWGFYAAVCFPVFFTSVLFLAVWHLKYITHLRLLDQVGSAPSTKKVLSIVASESYRRQV